MGNAIISRRGGGYANVKFEKYGNYTLPTKSTATALSQGRSNLAATTVGSYALFGGGITSSYTYFSTVDAYNSILTRSTPTSLSQSREKLAATTVGNYALFGGGYNGTSPGFSNVDAYNTSLAKSTPISLVQERSHLAATSVGGYALFAGGLNYHIPEYNQTKYYSTVDAYNISLARSTPTALSEARYFLAATTVGDYALFGGGIIFSDYSSTVDAYNNSLTRIIVDSLNTARSYLAATSVGDCAIFGGGNNGNFLSTVDAYKNVIDNLQTTVFRGCKYKFQNMISEVTVTSNVEEISIPTPATGYVKFKNITIS